MMKCGANLSPLLPQLPPSHPSSSSLAPGKATRPEFLSVCCQQLSKSISQQRNCATLREPLCVPSTATTSTPTTRPERQPKSGRPTDGQGDTHDLGVPRSGVPIWRTGPVPSNPRGSLVESDAVPGTQLGRKNRRNHVRVSIWTI